MTDARAVGAALQARGLVPGDHVAILGPTSRQLITIVQGCWLAGIASMVLPLPMRMGSLEAFIEGTRARSATAMPRCPRRRAARRLLPSRPGDPPIQPDGVGTAGAGKPNGERLVIRRTTRSGLVILQYTSGSTSEPKGVMIPDRVLTANIDACCEAAELNRDEVMVSWLPLYHDMGLVGFLALPMSQGVQLVQAAPQDFLSRPGNWMQWVSDWRGTATAGPNFAWVLATRALKRAPRDDGDTSRPVVADARVERCRARRPERR
jgi:fatty-acyl-CoA synthase